MAFKNPIDAAPLAPDTPELFWPCVSGEDNPPTFTGTAGYSGPVFGQPAIKLPAVAASAAWPAMRRYGPGFQGVHVVTFLLWAPAYDLDDHTYTARVGWDGALGLTLHGLGSATGATVDLATGDPVAAGPVPIAAGRWSQVELVYAPTLTRLTVASNEDSAGGQLVGAPAPDNTLGLFRFDSPVMDAGPRPIYLANLRARYLTEVPA